MLSKSAPSSLHTISFSSLSPGSYKLDIIAVNAVNTKSRNTAHWSFVIAYPFWQRGWFYVLCVALVILGGLKRIASVSQIIVPFMAVIYVIYCAVLVIFNIGAVPAAFATIVKGAFNPQAITGGVVGRMPYRLGDAHMQ